MNLTVTVGCDKSNNKLSWTYKSQEKLVECKNKQK